MQRGIGEKEMNKEKLVNFINSQIKDFDRCISNTKGDYECENEIHKLINLKIEIERCKSSKTTLESLKKLIEDGNF